MCLKIEKIRDYRVNGAYLTIILILIGISLIEIVIVHNIMDKIVEITLNYYYVLLSIWLNR